MKLSTVSLPCAVLPSGTGFRRPQATHARVSRSPLSCSYAADRHKTAMRESIGLMAEKIGKTAFTLALGASLAVGGVL